MGTNKEQTPEFKNKANYETAVLDFLDKEMAAIQSNKKQNESGQEVDDLVTDLLKQVITESDQPNAESQTGSDSLEAALSEDPPMVIPPVTQKEEAPPSAEHLESADEVENCAADTQESAAEPTQEPSVDEPVSPRFPNLALGAAPRRKFSIIAVASVCLTVAVGAAVLYLWGSSRKDANTEGFRPAAATLARENANMDIPAILPQPSTAEPGFSSSTGNSANSEQIPPQPVRKTQSAQFSGSVTAASAQKAAAPRPQPAAPAATDQSADRAAETESEIPEVEFLTAQISAPSPLTTASNLNIDKSAPPPMPNGIALSNSALEANPRLTSPSQASGPAGSRNLVPSVLISQVSPAYPELAIRSRTSGTVVLELQIDTEGKVVEATPVSGPAVFYNEAVKAAMQYRYRPATLNGRNMSSKSRVTMVFNYNR